MFSPQYKPSDRCSFPWINRRNLLLVVSVFSLIFISCCDLNAQTVNATLRGTVTDSSGAAVAGAEITLLEPTTGQTVRKASSQASGDFEFDELKPGTYELRCGATGFKMFVAQNIILDSGQIRRLDPQLALGQAVEEVTVSAGAAVISTESATISDMFTAKQHDQSPQVTIYPSTWYQLTTLAGVQGGTYPPVADGQEQQQQTQTFDGIPNDLQGIQNNNANFFEQVSATVFNAPAESPVPVQLSQVTKRGQNAFHGKATYRIYDSVFNSSGYFDTSKTPYLQHEWDLEASGPIWKDHTFFYGGWFAQRIPLGTFVTANVPTNPWRNGVFSTTIIDPSTGLPFANNTIPANRISSVAAAVQSQYLPAPDVDINTPVNNYAFHFPFNSDLYRGDWPIVRVDHNLTKSNSLFVRWLMRKTPYVLNNGLPALIWTRARTHQQWAAGDTQIFSPTLVNNFRFGYSSDYIVDGQNEAGQTPPDGSKVLSSIGLQGSNPSQLTGQGFPEIDITGLTSLSNVSGGVKADNHIYTVNDSIDWQIGQHAVKFGGSIQHYSNFYGVVPNYGTFTFDGSITGQPYADFLLGLPQESQRVNPLGNQSQTLNEYGLYAEDSFKISHKLTLTYGIRWDLYGTPSSTSHLMYNWDPSTGDVIVDPKALSQVSPLYPSGITVVPGSVQAIADKSNFVPRIGVAYALTDHSVVRAGYGIYTSRFGAAGAFNNFLPINPQLGSTGPFSISEAYQNVVKTGTAPLLSFPNPYPSTTASVSVPSQTVYGYPRDVSHGHIHQYSLSYEEEIAHIGLRASYLGSVGTGLNYSVNVNLPQPGTLPFNPNFNPNSTPSNPSDACGPTTTPACSVRPYPQFFTTNLLRFDGGTRFNSLQLEAKRRLGGLTFNASYSYTESLANYLDTENPYDVLNHWANDGQTRRNYVSASMIWALPFGKGQRFLSDSGGAVDRIVGGWSTSVATFLASGLGFSPAFSGPDPSNTGTFGGLPDLVGDPNNIPGGKNYNNWFNTAAFAVPQAGHFGDARPNSLEGQHLYQTHLSLTKSVPITERIHFNFMTQISNIFNHPQFLTPSGNISVPGGNQFTSQYGVFDSLESGQVRQITFQGGFTF
jgi:hypothetical protein